MREVLLFIILKLKDLLWNIRNQASEFLGGEELRSFWLPILFSYAFGSTLELLKAKTVKKVIPLLESIHG